MVEIWLRRYPIDSFTFSLRGHTRQDTAGLHAVPKNPSQASKRCLVLGTQSYFLLDLLLLFSAANFPQLCFGDVL